MSVLHGDSIASDTDNEDEDSLLNRHEYEAASESDSKRGDFYTNYELADVLGRGMASVVRKCIDKYTGRMYAVKIVDITTEHQSVRDAERLREETRDEIDILRELQGHPSIIELHDVYETSTYFFLVFEMASLGELFDVLTREVTFSEKRTKRTMRQIMAGVAHIHSHDIMHRDLKLENILCIDSNKVIITDFGFARRLKPNEKVKELFGTPGYLAPEALKAQMYEDHKGYSKEVDVWACGVIMYTLLAGYAPFYHRRQMMMLRMIQDGKYQFPAEHWDAVSEEAKDLIRRLLVTDPSERLTAEQALQHPFLAGPTAIERPISEKEQPMYRFKRAIRCVRFLVRLTHIQDVVVKHDRPTLRKRPYRDRVIRHEAEATVFAVYGHWVNKGFYESRDLLFANRPRPKRQRNQVVGEDILTVPAVKMFVS